MHKKLASDLTSLAHSILQIKNKEDVFLLKQKAYQVYEKLSLLAYVEEYINTTPNAEFTKAELVAKIEAVSKKTKEKSLHKLEEQELIGKLEQEEMQIIDAANKVTETEIEQINKEKVKESIEQPFEELERLIYADDDVKNDMRDVGDKKVPTLEEELKDTISVDSIVNLFEKAETKTLNDQLLTNIEIGLNDRIAFVKNLFDGNQEDFNRVISQLNTLKSEKEAIKFINKMVKPDYDWTEKEAYETRFLEIVQRRFS